MNTIAHSYNTTTTTNSEMEEIEKVMKELLEQKEQLLTILCEQQTAVEQTTIYQSSLVSPIEANALWQQTNAFIQQLRNGVNNEIYQIDEQIKTLKNQLNSLLANNNNNINNIQQIPSVSNMSNVSSISNMSIPSVPMTECENIDINPANLPSISNTSSAGSILSGPNPTDTDTSSNSSDGDNGINDVKIGDNNEQPHSWDDIDQIEEFKFDSNGVVNQFNGGMKRKVIKGKRGIKGLKSGKLGKSKSKQSQVNNILNANASEYNGNGDYTGNPDNNGSLNENDNGYTYRMDELCCIDNLSATYDCLISLILTNSGLNSKERNDSISKRFGRLAEKIGFVNELIKTKMNTDGKDSQLDTIPEE